MQRSLAISAAVGVAAATALAAGSSPVGADAHGDTVVGLVGGNVLVQFDASDPANVISSAPITGLAAGEWVMSIDGRPGTGQIVALAVTDTPGADTARLYTVDPDTGLAMPTGDVSIPDIDDGARTTVDFNPTVDRLRVLGSGDQNLRVNPNNGALAAEDTPLNPPGSQIVAIAYDQNVVAYEPGNPTNLFGISRLGAFVRVGGVDGMPSPNDGAVTVVGALGAVPDDDGVGFDISSGGTAYATMRVGGTTGLYEIDTSTGGASFVGEVGNGMLDVRDIAVRVDDGERAAQYTPLAAPTRLLDTRSGERVAPGGTVDVQVIGRAGVPPTATSAVVNVTVTEAGAAGFATVYPSGTTRPNTSNVNVDSGTQTRAALVTTPIGADGSVSVFSDPGSHVIVDVIGYYAPVTTGGGALTPVTPSRLLDTRNGIGVPGGSTSKPSGGSTVQIAVLDRAGVPAEGVGAVVVNLTATEAAGPGYLTTWGDGDVVPVASNLNVSAAGETIANLAVVPVSAEGTIRLFTEVETHLLVDVMGWFGDDPNVLATPEGLFVSMQPNRFLDTRQGAGPLAAGSVVDVAVAGAGGLPGSGVLAIAGTVTLTGSAAAGYVTAYPSGGLPPEASNLNVVAPDATVANGVIVGLGDGQLSLFTDQGGHLLTDISGYYQGR